MDPESKRRPGQGASPEASIAGERSDAGSVAPARGRAEGDPQRLLRVLFEVPGTVVELRALHLDRARVVSGYFDDPQKLIGEARRLDGRAEGLYVTLNPVRPELLARANNRVVWRPKATTRDDEILRRRLFLVDLDPDRPTGISSRAAEREASAALGLEIRDHLASLGFPAPILADSGNGTHLLYRVDLPSDDGDLLARCLEALAFRFDGDEVRVDPGVFNPARLCKLYGTLVRKGDATSDRPHHRSRLLDAPDRLEVVPDAVLRGLAAEAPPQAERRRELDLGATQAMDVERFLSEHGLAVARSAPWKDGRRWVLDECPFERQHADGAAYVVQLGSGAVAAGCHHASCNGWTWQDLRQKLDPGRFSRECLGSARSNGANGRSPSARADSVDPARYESFPTDVLPEPLSTFVDEASAALGCDPCFVALPLLASVAAAIGNTRRIRLKAQWCEPSVLWTVIVGESGTLKSPAMDLALEPIRQRQEAELRRHAEAMAAHREDLLRYEAERRSWLKADSTGPPPSPPVEPREVRYLCSDVTVEALAVLLGKSPRGLLLARDELSGWLRSFDAYRKGRGGDSARWLEMNRAGQLLVDRKTGSSDVLLVPRAAVSITGSIQPEVLRSTLGREHLANGMAARLLLAMPPRRAKAWTDREVSRTTMDEVGRLFDRLLALTFVDEPSRAPCNLPLSAGARRSWIEFYDSHAQEQAQLVGDLASAWSKIEAYAARFALVVHCVRVAASTGGGPSSEEVDRESVLAGATLARWFAAEAARVYAVLRESAEDRRIRELVEVIRSMGGETTTRDLMRHSRPHRTTAIRTEGALQELVDQGLGDWRQRTASSMGGRPTKVFQLRETQPEADDGDTTPAPDSGTDGFVPVSARSGS